MPEEQHQPRVAISVSDMARLVGLSRSRFHQLLKEGVFPPPNKCEQSGRPYYDHAGQEACLTIRRTNQGLNGRTIMFYARRFGRIEDLKGGRRSRPSNSRGSSSSSASSSSLAQNHKAPRRTTSPMPRHAALIDGLRQLGLSDLTDAQVAAAIAEVFPQGVDSQPHEAVLLAVFRHLIRRDSGENVGR